MEISHVDTVVYNTKSNAAFDLDEGTNIAGLRPHDLEKIDQPFLLFLSETKNFVFVPRVKIVVSHHDPEIKLSGNRRRVASDFMLEAVPGSNKFFIYDVIFKRYLCIGMMQSKDGYQIFARKKTPRDLGKDEDRSLYEFQFVEVTKGFYKIFVQDKCLFDTGATGLGSIARIRAAKEDDVVERPKIFQLSLRHVKYHIFIFFSFGFS